MGTSGQDHIPALRLLLLMSGPKQLLTSVWKVETSKSSNLPGWLRLGAAGVLPSP